MDRTQEEVDLVVHHAKLQTEELLKETKVIEFGKELLDQNTFKLLQVPKFLVDEMKSSKGSSSSITIRGERNDSAVLCTGSKTYEMKEAETSNSWLIVPRLGPFKELESIDAKTRSMTPLEILGVFNKYVELNEIKPRLSKLYQILIQKPYAKITEIDPVGYTKEELLNNIQCSDRELEIGLNEIQAIKSPENKWYILDQDYKMKIITLINNYAEENSWTFKTLRRDQTIEILSELEPSWILEQVFDQFTFEGKNQNFIYDEYKTCRFFGNYLLGSGTSFNFNEFNKIWKESVPEGLNTSLNQLKGLALVFDTTIRSFPESSLPLDIHDRLDILFKVREKWTLEEISPYLEALTTLKINVKGLLTKFARSTTLKGIKYFCSKHGK